MKLRTTYLTVVVALVVSAISVPVAAAGNPSPAALRALDTRGQGLDDLCEGVTLVGSAYRAVCGTEGIAARLTPAVARSLDIRGQGMDRLCSKGNGLSSDGFAALCTPGGRAIGQVTQVIRPGGFQWDDFGFGAGAMLGLTLVAGGLVAAAHYSRRTGMRSRPAP